MVIPSESFVALAHGLKDGIVTQPGLNHHVFAQGDIPHQQHLLPHHRRHPRRSHIAMIEIYEFLQQRLDDMCVVRPDRFIELVGIRVQLIAAGVEVCAVCRRTGKEIFPKGMQEIVDGRGVELEAAAGWFVGVFDPVGLDVVCSDKIWVGPMNGAGVPGHVDLEDDFNASVHAVFLDLRKVLGTVCQIGPVGTFLGEFRQCGDVERPALPIGHM